MLRQIQSTIKPIFHCDAKYLASGVGVGQLMPPTPELCIGDINMLVSWSQRKPFALPPTPNLKFALPPTPTPDASPWNIGGVGSSGVGHVYFMYISCTFHVVCASFSALAM